MSDTSGQSLVWTIVTHKWWLAKSVKGTHWQNTYEITVNDPTLMADSTEVAETVDVILAYERALHLGQVFFEKTNVLTYRPDSQPYNANEGKPYFHGVYGQRSAPVSDRLDLRNTYTVMREPTLGNPGRIKYRGVLTEADVVANEQGINRLAPGSGLVADGAEWLAARALVNPIIITEAGPGQPAYLGLAGGLDPDGTPTTFRLVVNLIPVGIGIDPLTHKHFNRVTPAPGA